MVTHRTREDLLGDNGGTFTFDGLEAAAKRAKDAAGDKDVWVLGAAVARQLLRAGLLDEVRIQLAPLLMGEGTPLFAGGRAELIPVGEPVAGGRLRGRRGWEGQTLVGPDWGETGVKQHRAPV